MKEDLREEARLPALLPLWLWLAWCVALRLARLEPGLLVEEVFAQLSKSTVHASPPGLMCATGGLSA